MVVTKATEYKTMFRVTHILKQPNPPAGQKLETPHIVVLKNTGGYTLVYLVEGAELTDFNIGDIISFEDATPLRGYNTATNNTSGKKLTLSIYDTNISAAEVKGKHIPNFKE